MDRDHERIPFYIVDAFTDEPFRGNPAAVCLLKQQHDDNILQSIAAEFNLSETAFLLKPTEKPVEDSQVFSLRWFTPKTEVALCGHATLATAVVLFHELNISASRVTFQTKSGELGAEREDDRILLNFPSESIAPTLPSQQLLRSMNISDFEEAYLSHTSKKLLIRLKKEDTLRGLEPDFKRLKTISEEENIKGVIVTSTGHPPHDFVSRFFAPRLGVDEDPVTGAAHTILAPYWAEILGKQEMSAYQASSRGGELTVRVREKNRVDLIGKALIIAKGNLNLYAHTRKMKSQYKNVKINQAF